MPRNETSSALEFRFLVHEVNFRFNHTRASDSYFDTEGDEAGLVGFDGWGGRSPSG